MRRPGPILCERIQGSKSVPGFPAPISPREDGTPRINVGMAFVAGRGEGAAGADKPIMH